MNWLIDVHYNLVRSTEKVESNIVEGDTTFYRSYIEYYSSVDVPVFRPDICLYLVLNEYSRIMETNRNFVSIFLKSSPDNFEIIHKIAQMKSSSASRTYSSISSKSVRVLGSREEWEYVKWCISSLSSDHSFPGMKWKSYSHACVNEIEKLIHNQSVNILAFYENVHEIRSNISYITWVEHETERMFLKVVGFVNDDASYGECTYEVFDRFVFDMITNEI